jgi:hypothetical protein
MTPVHCEILILLLVVLTFYSVCAGEIRLIVRGDDLGMTQGLIAGFEKAFKEGVLTSASIQVPAPWFEAAADLAKQHPQWCFGVHLTLIGEWRGYRWRPVLPWDQVTSIGGYGTFVQNVQKTVSSISLVWGKGLKDRGGEGRPLRSDEGRWKGWRPEPGEIRCAVPD